MVLTETVKSFAFALFGLGVASLVAGCTPSSVQRAPADVLRAYAAALGQGRADDAYAMLTDEAKRSLPLEAFRRAVRESPEDMAEMARALARPASDPVVTATVALPDGEELTLLLERGAWHVDGATIDRYGQSTPRQALLAFLRAFERKRYDVLLRFVPDAERNAPPAAEVPATKPTPPSEPSVAVPSAPPSAPSTAADTGLTAEKLRASWEGPQKEQMLQITQAIKAALPTSTIEETGENAAMSYGSGGTVTFVREHGVWKIRDVH